MDRIVQHVRGFAGGLKQQCAQVALPECCSSHEGLHLDAQILD